MKLEDKLTAILDDEGLSQDEKVCRLSKAIFQHAPKKFSGWSDLLRKLADYIDSRPEPVMLSAKAIGGFIEMQGWKD